MFIVDKTAIWIDETYSKIIELSFCWINSYTLRANWEPGDRHNTYISNNDCHFNSQRSKLYLYFLKLYSIQYHYFSGVCKSFEN